jgi:hypothetical protein
LKVTIFATTFNHQNYVCDLLDSIEREFLPETGIVLADLGSSDSTLESIRGHSLYIEKKIKLVVFDRGTTTLHALFQELLYIPTEYVLGMSGDDVFEIGFGKALRDFELKNQSEKVMINVTLIHTDESLRPFMVQNPRWSKIRSLNRCKLSIGNPGTGPGAIYPVKELIGALDGKDFAGLLIEDYYIYWQLIDLVKFVNLKTAQILYRRHSNALGNRNADPLYSKSIGQSVGIALKKSKNPIEFSCCLFLVARWVRHIPIRNLSDYVLGILLGYRQ